MKANILILLLGLQTFHQLFKIMAHAFWSLLNFLLKKIHRIMQLQLQDPLYRVCEGELSTVTYKKKYTVLCSLQGS